MSPLRRKASTISGTSLRASPANPPTRIRFGYPRTVLGNPWPMEHDQTERVIEETGVGDPLAERNTEQPAKPASDIKPEDATPEEGVERPETDGPGPGPYGRRATEGLLT